MIKSKTATLRNSAWCPQPIVLQSFFCQKHHHGWPTAKGHMELMTDFQAGNIFDNPRTKDKEKGQRQVSLFWAWDDSKNVRNFSMLIIMAVRGRFGLRLFLSPENTSAAQFRRRIVVEMFAPDPLLPQNKLETKKGGNTQFFNVWLSVHGKRCLRHFWDWKRCKMCFYCNHILLQPESSCREWQLVPPPASKCRSFGKTESWARRIITVHFSNWAEAKQFQNLSPPLPPPPPHASCSSFPMCHQCVCDPAKTVSVSHFFASV